jgi:hypothetical protein
MRSAIESYQPDPLRAFPPWATVLAPWVRAARDRPGAAAEVLRSGAYRSASIQFCGHR